MKNYTNNLEKLKANEYKGFQEQLKWARENITTKEDIAFYRAELENRKEVSNGYSVGNVLNLCTLIVAIMFGVITIINSVFEKKMVDLDILSSLMFVGVIILLGICVVAADTKRAKNCLKKHDFFFEEVLDIREKEIKKI